MVRRWLASPAGLALAEQARWITWLPVALGAGVALYFALPYEPWPWPAPVVGLMAVAGGFAARARPFALALAVGVAAFAAGFTAAQVRTHAVAAPVLAEATGTVTVHGRVADVDPGTAGYDLHLAVPRIARLDADATPHRVRVSVEAEILDAGTVKAPPVGARVRVEARLWPPPGPAAPGAFDFARRAWFQQLGGVGYAVTAPAQIAPPRPTGLAAHMAAAREAIVERARAVVPGPAGGVVAALMTGERSAIPDAVLDAVRAAGLAHLLAISGLHMGLVAGIVFFGVRAGLALVPWLVLRLPAKKIAAATALAAVLGYMLLTGAPLPTQRAFLMTALVLGAVLLDRRAISMRLVAWAATAILLGQPEALLGASFQMSFSAVVALVAAYEWAAPRFAAWRGHLRDAGQGWQLPLWYLAGVAFSTLVAGAATAPFAAFHFNRLAAYSLAANLAAVPLTGLWVMPWTLLAFLGWPAGVESVALVPAGWGTRGLVAVAREVASWAGAVHYVAAGSGWGLVLVALGGLWLCLWQRWWRVWGLAGVAAGFAVLVLTPRPDVLVARDGGMMAVRGRDGKLWLSRDEGSDYTTRLWLRRNGQPVAAARSWPERGRAAGGPLRCDGLGCVLREGGTTVALVRDTRALATACRRADVVVAPRVTLTACARRTVDRAAIDRHGAHALYVDGAGVRVATARPAPGARPWTAGR